MKNKYTWLVAPIFVLSMFVSSCIDEIAFGNSFLEKAPGGDVTEDTVFNSAEYARQFLNAIYSWQYYGLPYNNSNKSFPWKNDYWIGSAENMTDLYQMGWTSNSFYARYYTGTLEASQSESKNKCDFVRNNTWHIARAGWKLIERIDKVPGMEETEKKLMKAQAKCLMADAYYYTFRHIGGLPLVKQTYEGSEGDYNLSRSTAEETVNFILELLDEAIPELPWAYDASNPPSYDNQANDMGHWTKAGAMALKCKVLLFAASPLFNDDVPFAGGGSEAEVQKLIWFGSYNSDWWMKCYNACRDFFNELNSRGYYGLHQVSTTNPTPGEYRAAYRYAYFNVNSREILHYVRITDNPNKENYFSSGLYNANRIGWPTYEYMCKFPWADGTPFDWEKATAEGKLNEIFTKSIAPNETYDASNIILTRDPRLYETMQVNGCPKSLSDDGVMSGVPYELWYRGKDAGTNQDLQTGRYGTGFCNNKFILDGSAKNYPAQWPSLRLSDLYLTYAEAILQATGNHQEAISYIDKVRARVGLKGLVSCNPDKRLETDKEALLQAILDERACELAFEESRLFDLIRYKRNDEFEKPLHVLYIERLGEDGEVIEDQWYDKDQTAGKPFPTAYNYEVRDITTGKRVWWTDGFAPKWYLSPITQSEIDKGYLIQNPGW